MPDGEGEFARRLRMICRVTRSSSADTFEVVSQIRNKGLDGKTVVERGNRDPGDSEDFLIRGAVIKTHGQRCRWIDRTVAAGREEALLYEVA
ncbi:hypothetical protein ASC74_03305 [Pseudomonas sp. Root329]|nr:hypothetical protein ASC74_03305 [Pseudomonas sp. Root329]